MTRIANTQKVEVQLCNADRELLRRLSIKAAKSREVFTNKPAELGNLSINVQLDDGACVPTRAHSTDAGLDLYATETKTIYSHGMADYEWDSEEQLKKLIRLRQSTAFDTGVHVEIPHGYFGKIESKSGLNVNHDIVCCGGVIDEGYTGSIVVNLFNLGLKPYTVHAGDKIAQLIIQPCIYPSVNVVDSIEQNTERGDNGFGSTGK